MAIILTYQFAVWNLNELVVSVWEDNSNLQNILNFVLFILLIIIVLLL